MARRKTIDSIFGLPSSSRRKHRRSGVSALLVLVFTLAAIWMNREPAPPAADSPAGTPVSSELSDSSESDSSASNSNSKSHSKSKAIPSNRPTLNGTVVKVSDGDTLTLLKDKIQTKVRLVGIDAPEKNQPFGTKCRKTLADLVAGKDVTVEIADRDRYGRTIGRILTEGRDANLAQIEAGCAWHYKQYARNQTPIERTLYAEAETKARASRVGLWQDKNPVAPWAFRKSQRDQRLPAARKKASGQ